MTEVFYGGSGLIWDEASQDFVYVENSYWDEAYQGWRACPATHHPVKVSILVNGQAVEVEEVCHVVS